MGKKIIGVAGLLDYKSNRIIEDIMLCLKNKGLLFNEIQPHITIGIYEDLELDILLEWVEEFSKNHSILDIYFNHIGFFKEEMCFIGLRINYELLDFYKNFHLKYDDFAKDAGYYYAYNTNQWSPHLTIAYGSSTEVLKSFIVLKEIFRPFRGKIVSLSVSQLKPMKEIEVFKLRENY